MYDILIYSEASAAYEPVTVVHPRFYVPWPEDRRM